MEWGLLGEYARGTGCKGLGIWEVGVTVVESEDRRDKDRWGPTATRKGWVTRPAGLGSSIRSRCP